MVTTMPVMAFVVRLFMVVMMRSRPVVTFARYGNGSSGGATERTADNGAVTTAKLVAQGGADTAANGTSQKGIPLSAGEGCRQGQQSGQGKC